MRLRLVGTRSRAIRRRTSKEGANVRTGEADHFYSVYQRINSLGCAWQSRKALPVAHARLLRVKDPAIWSTGSLGRPHESLYLHRLLLKCHPKSDLLPGDSYRMGSCW